jgi:hypothetical protein
VKRVWAWLKRRGWLLLVAVCLLFGLEFARRGRTLRTLRDELALARARQNVERLRALRDAAGELGEANQSVIERIDAEIYDQRVVAVRAYEEGRELPLPEVEKRFAELGF